jgi:imidazolonepropionase-like amidohydrolase
MKTILTNCNVIDCTGGPVISDMTVIIEGNRITAIETGVYESEPAGKERVFNLDGGYVLPGLWDVHTHLGDLIPDPRNLLETESPIDYAIRAGRNAMDALRSGITGIRILGEDHYADVAWKNAFDRNVFMGPRLFVCGRAMSITGGHGHGTLGAFEVDGADEVRKAVRENIKHGVDQIKLMVTGGVMTEGEGMQESQFLLDEIQAATEVAHQRGRKVCVHSWGTDGVKTAIKGGVDCIEHGLLDDEAVGMMKEHDLFYVPTIHVTQDRKRILESGRPDFMKKKALGSADLHLQGFQKALKAGLKIACGADSSPVSEFTFLEIEHLVKAGMKEMDTLISATRTSADLCGVADRLGTVETGKLADLIVLADNPLENISNIRKLKMVIKDGNIVETRQPEGIADFRELFF